MLKNPILLITLLAVSVFSCNKFKKTEGGLEYQIVTDKEGDNARSGDMLILKVKYNNKKDSLDTFEKGAPINALLDSSIIKPGTIEEGLLNLSIGDSAIFKISNKILYEETFKIPLPKELKPEETTTFYIKVDTIYSKEFIKKEQVKMMTQQMEMVASLKKTILDSASNQKQLKADDIIILNYINQKGLKATKTQNGVYVAIADSGKGKSLNPGDKVSLDYVGKFTSDKVFQNSTELGKPFEYVSGVGQVILGWDEGAIGLKEGSKATIIIPSTLAYGKMGAPDPQTGQYVIPPNSIVIYEISIKKIESLK